MPGMKKDKKAKSKSQQRLFGMVTAYKSGKLDIDDLPPSLAKKVKGIADGTRKKSGDKRKNTKGITKKAAKEMAGTKHKGLPETIKENYTKRFEDFINESKGDDDYLDALKGGQAEDMTIQDIADKHNVSIEYFEKILADAIEIELEHTDDADVAARIVLDHLWETPLYYDEILGLPNMEEELEELDDEEVEDIVDDRLEKEVKKFEDSEEELEEDEQEHKSQVNDVEKVQESAIIKLSEYISESSLNDFLNSIGDTEIWYEKAINFDGWDFRKEMYEKEKEHDMEYTERYGSLPDPNNLEKTHALLGTIGETDLNTIYDLMNNWGVGEESNKFLKNKGVSHTSMSIGDIIKMGDDVFFVDDRGFKNIKN